EIQSHEYWYSYTVKNRQIKRIVSKQGRENLKSQQNFQDIDDLVDEEVIVKDKGNGEKGGNTAETVSTARPDISAAMPEVSTTEPKTAPTTTTLSITTLQPLPTIDPKDKVLDEEFKTKRERQEDASKVALARLYDEVQAQINAGHKLAARLTYEEQEKYTADERSKLLAEFFKRRKKQLAKERAEAIRSKPPTKTQLRNLMMTYLKHTSRFTHAQLKSKSFKEIQKLYTKEHKWVDAFVPIGFKEDEKRVRSRKKRAADDDKEINYETLDVKSPIVDYESQNLGTMEAVSINMFVEKRYPLTKEILKKMLSWRLEAEIEKGYDLILWGGLKTLIESSEDDEI
nr:hypothetical protein [Tanacetum cinerariifolium]